jgi:hypothetical protein
MKDPYLSRDSWDYVAWRDVQVGDRLGLVEHSEILVPSLAALFVRVATSRRS